MAEPERLCLTSRLNMTLELVSVPSKTLVLESSVDAIEPLLLVSNIGKTVELISRVDLEEVTA